MDKGDYVSNRKGHGSTTTPILYDVCSRGTITDQYLKDHFITIALITSILDYSPSSRLVSEKLWDSCYDEGGSYCE